MELGPGLYTLFNSVLLKSNVRLVGAGSDKTILRKCDGVASGFAVDADYGQTKVTVQDPTGFAAGMGVVVRDDRSGGWTDTLATITLVQGSTLHLDREFVMDYDGDAGGLASNAFPPVAAFGAEGVVIEGICVDGNKLANRAINGCIGGGYYLHRVRNSRIADCALHDFAGDGISFQITQDIVVERCEVHHITGLGFHPGTGSARPIIRDCRSHHNDQDGFFLCWRAQEGRFEGNEFCDNGRFGISIGHKDTDEPVREERGPRKPCRMASSSATRSRPTRGAATPSRRTPSRTTSAAGSRSVVHDRPALREEHHPRHTPGQGAHAGDRDQRGRALCAVRGGQSDRELRGGGDAGVRGGGVADQGGIATRCAGTFNSSS